MNWLLGFVVAIFAITNLLEKLIDLIEKLKSSESAKLKGGFKATLSVAPIGKKSEDVSTHKPH